MSKPTPEQRLMGALITQRNQAMDALAQVMAERDTIAAELEELRNPPPPAPDPGPGPDGLAPDGQPG